MRSNGPSAALLAVCLGVLAPAVASAEPSRPAAATPLTGLDALKSVIGNTMVVAKEAGEEISLYLDQDGTVQSIIGGRSEGGTWSFSGQQLCFLKKGSSRSECGVMTVTGAQGSFEVERRAVAFKILPGNKVSQGSTSPPAAVGGEKLTGAKAVQALAGNTIEAHLPKGDTIVFLANGGDFILRQDNSVKKGKWLIESEGLCTDVQGHKDCFKVDVVGDKVFLLPTESSSKQSLEFKLSAGNAHHL